MEKEIKSNLMPDIIILKNEGFSYAKIAEKLTILHNRNVTRSAVSGAVSRASGRKKITKAVKKPRALKPPKPPKLKKSTQERVIFVPMAHPPTATQKTILQLKSTDCRFILDNGMYCGGLVYKRSFCKACYDICYQPMKVRK